MPNIPVAMDDRDYITVDIDDMIFTSNAAELLTIADIRDNIAFVVRGVSLSIKNTRVPFCGLYVWSGNDGGGSPMLRQAKFALDRFFCGLRKQLMFDEDSGIYLYELAFVGGERLEFDDECEMINPGNELEVDALQTAVQQYDFKMEMIDMERCDISFDNFLTISNQELSLRLSTAKWSKDINTRTEDDSDGYDADSDDLSESVSMNRMY